MELTLGQNSGMPKFGGGGAGGTKITKITFFHGSDRKSKDALHIQKSASYVNEDWRYLGGVPFWPENRLLSSLQIELGNWNLLSRFVEDIEMPQWGGGFYFSDLLHPLSSFILEMWFFGRILVCFKYVSCIILPINWATKLKFG